MLGVTVTVTVTLSAWAQQAPARTAAGTTAPADVTVTLPPLPTALPSLPLPSPQLTLPDVRLPGQHPSPSPSRSAASKATARSGGSTAHPATRRGSGSTPRPAAGSDPGAPRRLAADPAAGTSRAWNPAADWGWSGGGTSSDGTITRGEVMHRAATWVREQVPYSQVSWWTDGNGTYRQDCSGYVSMAWRLDEAANYWTGTLAGVAHPVTTTDLRPGDILLLPRVHTLIFAGWADAAHSRFNLFEEYARGRPARYAVGASIDYYLTLGFRPYRYNGIVEDLTRPARPAATPSSPSTPPSTRLAPLETVSWTPQIARYDVQDAPPPAPSAPSARITAAGSAGPAPDPLLMAASGALLACAFPLSALTAAALRGRRGHRPGRDGRTGV